MHPRSPSRHPNQARLLLLGGNARLQSYLAEAMGVSRSANPSPSPNTNTNPNPNQVYPPLPPGTILVASKGSNGAREIYRTHREARGANF